MSKIRLLPNLPNAGNIPRMTLREYLRAKALTPRLFGKQVGASEHTVIKWVRGDRMPRMSAMKKIVKATGGAVRPDDFYLTRAA